MQDEILKHLITILVSIVASVTTTILIYYIKSKRIKGLSLYNGVKRS